MKIFVLYLSMYRLDIIFSFLVETLINYEIGEDFYNVV